MKLLNDEFKKTLLREESDPEEQRLLQKAIEMRDKYMSMGKFKKGIDPFTKKLVNKAFNDLDAYKRNREKKSLNIDGIKKIFRDHGLTGTSYRSTAIRGYSIPSSNSYEIEKHDPKQISLHGVGRDTFNSIINAMKKEGFNFNHQEPSSVPGGPSHGSITLK
jgi:hypothetical protein